MADYTIPKSAIKPSPNLPRTRRSIVFAYGFMLIFFICTIFFLFNPSFSSSSSSSSPWLLKNLVNFRNRAFFSSQNGSRISSYFSHRFPNSSSSSNSGNNVSGNVGIGPSSSSSFNKTHVADSPFFTNGSKNSNFDAVPAVNRSQLSNFSSSDLGNNVSGNVGIVPLPSPSSSNMTHVVDPPFFTNGTKNSNFSAGNGNFDAVPGVNDSQISNFSSTPETRKSDEVIVNGTLEYTRVDGPISECNIFEGDWVKDDTYPLYAPGSCPHIDEPFNCFLNHRPENTYERYRWQPHGCNIPRLNGTHMLELLRGKRLVFVGDSLNRNMWESLVCVLRNSVEDKSKVFEASGRQEFRSEGSYSFMFEDYNCSVEFFRSIYLVQEGEVLDKNGSKTETLRLDLVESSSDRFRDADVLIFNTGHWWSHDKNMRGQGYYQEGSHVYDELDVIEAFRRALTTWGRWVDANVDRKKTQIFFRGYSASHFGGGKWNSGGRCDKETEPFKDESYLLSYPVNMQVLEDVLKGMRTPVFYLNITRLTDYRKDAHPSIYRGQDLTEEERRSPLRYQDCSHWCLPGVPDTWNEFVYSQLLIRHHQRLEEEQQRKQHRKKI